jgi:hypothetical protein
LKDYKSVEKNKNGSQKKEDRKLSIKVANMKNGKDQPISTISGTKVGYELNEINGNLTNQEFKSTEEQ